MRFLLFTCFALLAISSTYSKECSETVLYPVVDALSEDVNEVEPDVAPKIHCKTGCPYIYAPVCAQSTKNEMKQTFASQCALNAQNCKEPGSFTKVSDGACPCQDFCPYLLAPVCAKSDSPHDSPRKTFSSQCELDRYNCKEEGGYTKVHDGACECQRGCPKMYAPVCALVDGEQKRTFDNQCELDAENCRVHWSYTKISNEACKCNESCEKNYAPVCAEIDMGNRKQKKTFTNECLMNVEICKGSPYTMVSNSACPCNEFCPYLYAPICAKSLATNAPKTFTSQCELDRQNCKGEDNYAFDSEGACKCQEFCPYLYSPICARENSGKGLKTFSSPCELERQNCFGLETYTEVDVGPCECQKSCTRMLAPVCAENHFVEKKSFANECEFEVASCKSLGSYNKVSDGPCP